MKLTALAQDTFVDAEHDIRLHFDKQADGTVGMTLEQGPHKLSAPRQL
jgi:hypothetical protein